MNRIDCKFKELKEKNEKALIGFITAGDPNIDDSLKLIKNMCNPKSKLGLDILELGVAFSDPTADGPVIQRSSLRALKNGINLKSVLKMTEEIRNFSDIPIVLFSYYNPIFSYSVKKFYEDAKSAGADGMLIVDLPPEESAEVISLCEDGGLHFIRLIAPTTPVERIGQIIDSKASGFLYLVSKTGVTGSDGLDMTEIENLVAKVKSKTDLPLGVGFGISNADDVKNIAKIADGVVIGSAFEKIIEQNLDNKSYIDKIGKLVHEFKQACKGR